MLFISYSRKDKHIVDRFVSELRKKNYNVWIDSNGVCSGDRFEEKICKAIQDSSVVLFFSSKDSNQSIWVEREISYASDNDKRIIPIKLDDARYANAISLRLAGIDYVDCRNENDFDNAIKSVLTTLDIIEKNVEVSPELSTKNTGSLPDSLKIPFGGNEIYMLLSSNKEFYIGNIADKEHKFEWLKSNNTFNTQNVLMAGAVASSLLIFPIATLIVAVLYEIFKSDNKESFVVDEKFCKTISSGNYKFSVPQPDELEDVKEDDKGHCFVLRIKDNPNLIQNLIKNNPNLY